MSDFTVKDLMVPLSEYATVQKGATLFDAVMALEKAQEEFDHTKYRHRGVLVMDRNDNVIGKVNQMDVLCALEPKTEDLKRIKALGQFGFSDAFIWKLRAKRQLQQGSMKDFCSDAAKIRVEEIMQSPTEGEFVARDASLETAVHQLVQGRYLSLLVSDGTRIIGVLRMTDVFAAVFHVMKECTL